MGCGPGLVSAVAACRAWVVGVILMEQVGYETLS
jgi:hypothetical protein